MQNHVDLSQQRFGRLTALRYLPGSSWECRCQCGNIIAVLTYRLRNGNTRSCGCLRKETKANLKHGLAESKEYGVWCSMKGRCYNPKDPGYKNYGGRGIKVCKRWKNSFANFIADMGLRPSPKHSIDRIDNDGDYTPKNCRWATKETQANNARISEWQYDFGKRVAATGFYHNPHTGKWTPNRHNKNKHCYQPPHGFQDVGR